MHFVAKLRANLKTRKSREHLAVFVPCRCWMKGNNKALLAHYVINLTVPAFLVLSGIVMLFLVYQKIRTRDEWKQNSVAFLSIWGLICLFGTSWSLAFLNFGPLRDFINFFFCFLNSFQGLCLNSTISPG